MSPNGYIRRRRADVIEDTVRDVRSSPTRRPVVFAIILLRPETLRRLRPSWRSRRRRVRRFVHFPTMCDSTPSDDARPPSRPSNATPRSLFFAQCRQPPAFTGLQTAFIPLPDLRFDISHPQLSHRPSAAQKPHPKPVSFPFRPFFRTRVRPPHSNFASTRQRPRLLHRTYLLQCRLNSTTNQLTRPVVFLASFSQISMLTPDFLPGPHRNACTHAPAAVHPVDRSIAPRTHRRTPRYTQTFTFVLDAPHFATNPIYRLYHPRISSLFFAITSPHPKPTTTHSLHAASLHARRTHARTRDHPPRHCIAFLRSKNGPNFQLHRRRRHLKTSNHSIPPFSPSYPSPNFRAPPSPQRNSKRSLSASKSDRNGPITRRLFRHRRTPRYTQTFTFVLDAPHFATNPIYRLYHPRISSLFFAITSPHPKPTTTHSLHAASLHARRTHARTRDHPPRHCIAFLRSKNGPNFQLHRRRRHLKTSNHSIPPFSPSYPSPNFRAPPSPQRNSKRSLSASKSDRRRGI
jgi:hypothetical protein